MKNYPKNFLTSFTWACYTILCVVIHAVNNIKHSLDNPSLILNIISNVALWATDFILQGYSDGRIPKINAKT